MKKNRFLIIVILLLFLSPIITIAQRAGGVLISAESNNEKADPSAILEIKSSDKGLLIPRLTTDARNNIKPITDALTVYVTNEDEGFYFYDEIEQNWIKLLVVDPESPGMLIPMKGVIMYSGEVCLDDDNNACMFDSNGKGKSGSEMEGWHLCNGAANGIPDLTGKFIVGYHNDDTKETYDQNYEKAGNTGGALKNPINVENMPSHSHTLEADNADGNGEVKLNCSHTHKALDKGRDSETGESTDYNKSHQHGMQTRSNGKKNGGSFSRKDPKNMDMDEAGLYKTKSATINITNVSSVKAKITVDIDGEKIIKEIGNDNVSIDNRPLYYVLAYIIRIDKINEE